MAITESRVLPPQFIEDLATDYGKQLTALTAQPIDTSKIAPTVAGQDALQTQAASLAQSGVGSYQPFVTAAQQAGTDFGTGIASAQALTGTGAGTGTGSISSYMSPYQSQVIDTTLAEFDTQTAQGVPQLAANAINAGAFGGGREGVAQAQYASDAAQKRALLQAQLLGQGFTQANQLAQQGFEQQRNLASLQPSLAASGVQQLGAAGTGNLAYQQAQLDAAQQRNQLAYNEPLSRLNAFGSGIASQASGSPTTTTNTTLGGAGTVGPLSQALSAGLSAYGLGSIFGGN